MSREEQAALRQYFKGVPVDDLPVWALAFDAANGDPLRAQEIEEQVSERTWMRYLAYRREQARALEGIKHG